MRFIIRHCIAILLFLFVCKIALQSQEFTENSGVPKSLLLGSLSARQPIPSGRIDPRPIIEAIRKE
ncbi:MAG TPA: hypothetical protein VIH99_03060 [Bdellovibrionota bacterium]|jgi:hypothetical protein